MQQCDKSILDLKLLFQEWLFSMVSPRQVIIFCVLFCCCTLSCKEIIFTQGCYHQSRSAFYQLLKRIHATLKAKVSCAVVGREWLNWRLEIWIELLLEMIKKSRKMNNLWLLDVPLIILRFLYNRLAQTLHLDRTYWL